MFYQENYVRPKPIKDIIAENGLDDPNLKLDYYDTLKEYNSYQLGDLTGNKYFKCKTVNVKTVEFSYTKKEIKYKGEKLVIIAQIIDKDTNAETEHYFKCEFFNRCCLLDKADDPAEWSDNNVKVQDFLEYARGEKGIDIFGSVPYHTQYEEGNLYPKLSGVHLIIAIAKVGENTYNGKTRDKLEYALYNKNGMSVPEIEEGRKGCLDLKKKMEELHSKYNKFIGVSYDEPVPTVEPTPVVEQPKVTTVTAEPVIDDDEDLPF